MTNLIPFENSLEPQIINIDLDKVEKIYPAEFDQDGEDAFSIIVEYKGVDEVLDIEYENQKLRDLDFKKICDFLLSTNILQTK